MNLLYLIDGDRSHRIDRTRDVGSIEPDPVSRRPQSRRAFAERLSRDLGKEVRALDTWRACLEGALIQVEASRLEAPEPLFRTAWVETGNLVVPYGTMSAVEITLTEVMDKLIVDDWGQCKGGKLSEASLYGEFCEIVAGDKPGRERAQEAILFWHRGLSLTDIALGAAMLEKAKRLDLGQRLRYA